ncbi:MAG: DMT family transporter [Rhodospirillales bacterium]|nr:DMT family transporter [Rhodospirillales bacterium]
MKPSLSIGLAAALAAALVGTTWQVATRHGVTSTLHPLDLALFRYGAPALLLLPTVILLLRRSPVLLLGTRGRLLLLAMVLGGGLPFGLLAMGGAAFAPVAHMGALLPGTIPLFTGLLAALVLKDRLSATRLTGFAVIAAGVALVAGKALMIRGDQAWIGDLLFLAAALAWAVYTVAFQKSGLTPWQATAAVSAASAILVVPIWAAAGGPARLATAPWTDLATQAAAQGLLAGVAGQWTFALAVKHLGSTRAALSGALVPALAALGGWAILGERPDGTTLVGAVAIALGILVAGARPQAPKPQAAAPGRAPRPVAAD